MRWLTLFRRAYF